MRFFTVTQKPMIYKGEEYQVMGRFYWGEMPLPEGANIIGGYSNKNMAGALIQLKNGKYVCGSCGAISSIDFKGKEVF